MTFGGKAFTAIIAFIGIGIIAVPAGLVASALTKVANDEREGVQTNQSGEKHGANSHGQASAQRQADV